MAMGVPQNSEALSRIAMGCCPKTPKSELLLKHSISESPLSGSF